MEAKSSRSKTRKPAVSPPSSDRAGPGLPADLAPIATLVARIVERLNPEQILLFGSRAEWRARADSDYDLLAVLDDNASEASLELLNAW